MRVADGYDVVMLGSGPGGYVGAIRGAQLGLKVAVIERDLVGGVCLNWGCIPSKALLKNAELVSTIQQHGETWGLHFDGFRADFGEAVDRSRGAVDRLTQGVAGLLKKNRVDLIKGHGRVISPTAVQVDTADGTRTIEGRHVIIATGSRPRLLPGIEIDEDIVVTSRQAIDNRRLPGRAVIIGGGVIGAEFSYIWRSYGAEVTIVEALPRILPLEEPDVSALVHKSFTRNGIRILTDARVEGVERDGDVARVRVRTGDTEEILEADRVLVAIGVQGNTENIGLENVGIQPERSFIPVDPMMRTTVPGIYAIGDVNGQLPLAHAAFRMGELAMEHIAGHMPKPIELEYVPRATYCNPQVASFGLTEAQAKERGHDVVANAFPFRGVGKALAINEVDGFAKIIMDRKHGEILGAHLVGPEVTELLPELVLAREVEATVLEVGEAIHAHPTLSEVLKEAALAAMGRAIHA